MGQFRGTWGIILSNRLLNPRALIHHQRLLQHKPPSCSAGLMSVSNLEGIEYLPDIFDLLYMPQQFEGRLRLFGSKFVAS